MQTSTLLQPLLLLCLVAVGIDAYVYSCEEVKYRVSASYCMFTLDNFY